MDDARRREDASIRTEQRLTDFFERYKQDGERYERDNADARAWRASHDSTHKELLKEIDDRLKPFEVLRDRLDTPAKIIGGILVLMLTPVLGFLGWDITKWIIQHAEAMFKNGHP